MRLRTTLSSGALPWPSFDSQNHKKNNNFLKKEESLNGPSALSSSANSQRKIQGRWQMPYKDRWRKWACITVLDGKWTRFLCCPPSGRRNPAKLPPPWSCVVTIQHSTKTGKGRWHLRAPRVTSTAVRLCPSALSKRWLLYLLPPMASIKWGRRGVQEEEGAWTSDLLEPTVLAASGCLVSEKKYGSPAYPFPLRAASLS